jgi:hypothetical protein
MTTDDEVRQQLCGFCMEDIAVSLHDGKALCCDCHHEVAKGSDEIDCLSENLSCTLEPHILEWLGVNANHRAEVLEIAISHYGAALSNDLASEIVKAFIQGNIGTKP